MKKLFSILAISLLLVLMPLMQPRACTNILVSKGASKTGSTLISYAADSHVLYGELYFWPRSSWAAGTMLDIYEWDTGKFLGQIPQVSETYQVVGNMNEYQLAIAETTYGGRKELVDTTGIMDYGSLIYVTLQRAKNAREAMQVMTQLVEKYGYYSSGESFSIADPNEVWILEMIGKGTGNKGAVWVAMRIPEGYVSGHANQARITTFEYKNENDWNNADAMSFNSPDVIQFARDMGLFDGKDKKFSFSDTYAPLDFGAARFCEARVWSVFRQIDPKMEKYKDYAMGYDLENRMPLFVKATEKLDARDVMNFMRDHYEGTDMDMTVDMGAGAYNCPYRWRPLTWKVDEQTYFNERAIATQQTGFVFVAESRSWLPREIGGILWFGMDDAATTVFTPLYCGMERAPEKWARGYGDLMTFVPDAAFWVFNQVSNYAYTRYSDMYPEIQKVQQELEAKYVTEVKAIDAAAKTLYDTDKQAAMDLLTDYSVNTANNLVTRWQGMYAYLFTRYMDGNIKAPNPGKQNPLMKSPGYGPDWYKRIADDTGDKLKYPDEN